MGLNDPKRMGFVMAKLGIEDGTMHTTTAVGLILADLDFVAECELRGKDKVGMARALVNKWQAEQCLAS